MGISTNVFSEVRKAVEKGYDFCTRILNLIHDGTIQVMSPTHEEYILAKDLPFSFGIGERDSVAMAQKRGLIIATNEKKVVNFCNRKDIDVINLNHILRALWELEILSKDEVRGLMDDIEKHDNLVIVSKDEIISD